jgi:hypothetical protein
MASSTAKERQRRNSKRRNQKRSEPNHHLISKVTGILFLVAAILHLYFLWRTQIFLDALEEEGHFSIPVLLFRKHAATKTATASNGDLISSQSDDSQRIANTQANQSLPIQKTITNQQLTPHDPSIEGKFIVFIPIAGGQGTGNIIAGLLAAHLLALEFNRIVCVSPLYKAFWTPLNLPIQ